MELHLLLSHIEAAHHTQPTVCPNQGCDGTEFRLHQQVIKPLKDAVHQTVTVYRYQCLRCRRTFRVYPQGVTHAHTSRQVQEIAVLLYGLGLSFGAVSSALDVFGIYLSKSRVHDTIKSTKSLKPDLPRCVVFDAVQRSHLHRNVVHVHCMQHWLPLHLIANERSGLLLSVTALSKVQIALLCEHINPLMKAMNGEVVMAASYRSAEHT